MSNLHKMFRENIDYNSLSNFEKIDIINIDNRFLDKMSKEELLSFFNRLPKENKLSFLLKNKYLIKKFYDHNLIVIKLKRKLVKYLKIDNKDSKETIEIIKKIVKEVIENTEPNNIIDMYTNILMLSPESINLLSIKYIPKKNLIKIILANKNMIKYLEDSLTINDIINLLKKDNSIIYELRNPSGRIYELVKYSLKLIRSKKRNLAEYKTIIDFLISRYFFKQNGIGIIKDFLGDRHTKILAEDLLVLISDSFSEYKKKIILDLLEIADTNKIVNTNNLEFYSTKSKYMIELLEETSKWKNINAGPKKAFSKIV